MSAVLKYDAACRALELDAWEIREWARRRQGELLLELKERGELQSGSMVVDRRPCSLDGLGVTKEESSRSQKIAKLDRDSFERPLARCRRYAEEDPEKHIIDVMKAPAEVNGHRAAMASRLEADESLDFFPTPPWATRTLMEHILPVHVCAHEIVLTRPRGVYPP